MSGVIGSMMSRRTSEGYINSRGSGLVKEDHELPRLSDDPDVKMFFLSRGVTLNPPCFSLEHKSFNVETAVVVR